MNNNQDLEAYLSSMKSDLENKINGVKFNKLDMFPIGAIYQSTGSTSPASLFGGSWERIQGRFLLGTSSSYKVSSTGGESTHTLTINEMPKHNHTANNNLSQKLYFTTGYGNLGSAGGQLISILSLMNVSAQGGNAAHNNMPPYYAVGIWRRTA